MGVSGGPGEAQPCVSSECPFASPFASPFVSSPNVPEVPATLCTELCRVWVDVDEACVVDGGVGSPVSPASCGVGGRLFPPLPSVGEWPSFNLRLVLMLRGVEGRVGFSDLGEDSMIGSSASGRKMLLRVPWMVCGRVGNEGVVVVAVRDVDVGVKSTRLNEGLSSESFFNGAADRAPSSLLLTTFKGMSSGV